MKRRLEMLPKVADEMCMGRREALGVILSGALATYTACSSTTVEPPSSSADADAGAAPDAGGPNDSGTTVSCDNPPAGFDVGDVSNFPSGSWHAAGTSNDPYVVAQDANGYFAFSAICTHQGCTIGTPNATSGKTSCPCHGAQFDGNGAVLRGPARSPLPHYAVALCGSHLYVDSSTTVDSSSRLAAT